MSGVPDSINGLRIVESEWLTVTRSTLVTLTWRERLLSWPWRPWVPRRVVTTVVPSPHVYQFGDTLAMHPETLKRLRVELTR
jgi:hypothetical protein